MQNILYLKLHQKNKVNKSDIFLQDIADIWCIDENIRLSCGKIKIIQIESKKGNGKVVSILDIIKKIEKKISMIQIVSLGEEEALIMYVPDKKDSKIINIIKVFFVCLISFIGAGFAIMTFNNDGDVSKIFETITYLLTGKQGEGMSVMKLSYSIGLPTGILLFFNHFSKIQVSKDPTPIEVKMCSYKDDLCKTIIENNDDKKE